MQKGFLPALVVIIVAVAIALSMKPSPPDTDQIHLSAMHAEPAKPDSRPGTKEGPQAEISKTIAITEADQAKIQILNEILASRDDNDSRMDTELKHLSPATKHLIRERYQATKAEKRNERGTMVFLLGRNLASQEDIGFIHDVLNETPCRSLENCEKESADSVSPEERHYEGMNEMTLAYPQLMALKALESYLKNSDGALSSSALAELENAKRSPVHKVASMAEEISRSFASNGSRQ